MEQAARNALSEQAARAGWLKPEIEVNVVTANRPPLPCRQPASIEPLDLKTPGRMRFVAFCPGTEGARQEFLVRAAVSAEVLVAAAAIPAARLIAAEDLALERRDVSNAPDAISDLARAAGQSARRSLRPGQMLTLQALAAPVLVKRGDAVRIVARTGPVEVSNGGEAMESGRAGETVRVRNVATGKVIRARVTAGGIVEPLDLPMPMAPQSLE